MKQVRKPADILGAEIKRRRALAALTQTEMAERCGITCAGWSMWETGRGSPTIARLVAVARALGIQPSTLVRCLDSKRTAHMDEQRKRKGK